MLEKLKYRWVPFALAVVSLMLGLMALGGAVDWKGP